MANKNFKGKGKGGYKPKPSNRKPRPQKEVEEDKKVMKDGDINNPAYYYESADVLDQVMNFSFNEYGGMPVELWADENYGSMSNVTWDNHMVASFWVNPSIPETADTSPTAMDGATTAALRNFLKLSGSNAKTTNYAPQDVSILILALAEVIKCSTFIARAFGIAYLFNYRNRTYPEVLLRAMGIDPDSFSKNLADWRVRYNKLLAVASKIPFPADLPLFRKAADLYGSLYCDDNDSALAQTYMLCPYSFWMYDETYDSNGAGLVTTKIVNPNGLIGMNQVLDAFESMISVLLTSSALNYIYSDVMRCQQKGYITNMLTFNPIPENYIVMPVYNEEVKDWLHNAVFMGAPLATGSHHVTGLKFSNVTNENDVSCMAATNKLLYHPQFKVATKYGFEALIDFDHDNVTIEQKVRATRFTQRYDTITDGTNHWTDETALNDEYLVEACFYLDATNGNPDATISGTWLNAPSNVGATLKLMDVMSKFDWFPLQYRFYTDGGVDKVAVIGDTDYYTNVDYWLARKIYDYEIIHLLQIG